MLLISSIFSFLVGACIGSFLNVIIYRLPLERSIVYPGSHCAACGKPLRWFDNIPILSWCFLKGRAACCDTKIDARYPVIELLTAVLTYVIWTQFPPAEAIAYLIFTYALIVATGVDLDHFIIPDSVSLGGCVFGLLACVLVPTLQDTHNRIEALMGSALGLIIGGGGLLLISIIGTWVFRKDAMGLGDVKLIAAIGTVCGWKGVIFTIGAASLLGSVIGLFVIFGKSRKTGVPIPFGPFLAAGCLLYILKGHDWFNRYLYSIGWLW